MSTSEKELIGAVQQLIAAALPYAAKHKVNKCYCEACNNFRRVINYAAKLIEPLQPPEL